MSADNDPEAIKRSILRWFEEHPDKTVMETSTCPTNAYGWSLERHYAMEQLARQGIPGFAIHRNYKFEVYDWHVVRDAPAN